MTDIIWSDNSGNRYDVTQINSLLTDQVINNQKQIHVGSDSHRGRKSKHIAVAIAICLWSEEIKNGGWYCFKRSYVSKKKLPTIYDRLFYEVQISVETASYLRDVLGFDIEAVHVNVNPKESELSSKYAAQFKGYVEASGFKCYLKPDDWAAGGVADKHAR